MIIIISVAVILTGMW